MSNPPGERYLEVEDVGDVSVVRFLNGRIADYRDIDLASRELFAVVDGAKRDKVVIDMSTLEVLGSNLLWVFIAMQKKVNAVRGQLALCAVDRDPMLVFEITRLDKYFRILATVSEGLAYLAGPGDDLRIACPAGGCAGTSPANVGRVGNEVYLRCPECDVRFQLVLPEVPEGGEAAATVTGIWLPTYRGQEVRLVPGPPRVVRAPRRLDLLAADALRQLWASVPRPRRAVIDCRPADELSEQGVAVLTELLAEDGGKVVLLVSKDRPPKSASFPPDAPLYTEELEAVAALGEISAGAGPIAVKLVRLREG